MKPVFTKNTPSQRQRRVATTIHRALSQLLLEANYKIIIAEVSLSSDLRHADIFIVPAFEVPADEREKKIEMLKNDQPQLRYRLAAKLYLKYMPHLRFRVDQRFENAQRLDALLSS